MLFERATSQPRAPWSWFYVYLQAQDLKGAIYYRRVNRLDHWIDRAIIAWLNYKARWTR